MLQLLGSFFNYFGDLISINHSTIQAAQNLSNNNLLVLEQLFGELLILGDATN